MLNVPATVGLMVLAHPIVELLLEHGRFTSHDTAATAAALMFYAPGLLGYSAVKIASPSFYALRDSRTPVIISMASVGLNLVLNLALVRIMGYRGLALGTAIAAMFNALALLTLLGRRIGGIDGPRVAVALAKILAASAVMAVAAYAASQWLIAALPGAAWYLRSIQVFGAIGAGVVALVAAARLLGVTELKTAMDRVMNRIVRR
jgi:putative peptidoglycan lipid II flippase